jgi:hypothetical protein
MRIDGRTDMTKLIVAFRNFADAPKYHMLLRRCYKPRNLQTMVFENWNCVLFDDGTHVPKLLEKLM